MIEHTQQITDFGGTVPGDCLRAALASLLDREHIESVPHFAEIAPLDWREYVVEWLAGHRKEIRVYSDDPRRLLLWLGAGGLLGPSDITDPVAAALHVIEHASLNRAPTGRLLIAVGKSPRGDWTHAVLMRDGALVWDPHPDRAGLDDVRELWDIR